MNPAMIAIGMKLLQNPKVQGLLGGFPGMDKLLPMIQENGPTIEAALKPLTPEEQIIRAISTLSSQMPVGPAAEQYSASIGVILNGVMGLRSSLQKEKE